MVKWLSHNSDTVVFQVQILVGEPNCAPIVQRLVPRTFIPLTPVRIWLGVPMVCERSSTGQSTSLSHWRLPVQSRPFAPLSACLAQLARASRLHREGQEFESLNIHQKYKPAFAGFYFCMGCLDENDQSSTMSRFCKRSAAKSSGMPHRAFMPERVS